MRLVVTSDTHYPVPEGMIPDGDVFIHAGDLMERGYPNEWDSRVAWLADLPHKIKLFVPGNHDFHVQVYPGPALQDLRAAGVRVIGLPGNTNFDTFRLPNKMVVLGACHITNLPRWAFNTTEESITDYMRNHLPPTPDIVVSHMPIYGTLDISARNNQRVGCHAYQSYLRDAAYHTSPKYWFHGHIHEAYGKAQLGETTVYNVAMCDRMQHQVNPPIVLDL